MSELERARRLLSEFDAAAGTPEAIRYWTDALDVLDDVSSRPGPEQTTAVNIVARYAERLRESIDDALAKSPADPEHLRQLLVIVSELESFDLPHALDLQTLKARLSEPFLSASSR